MAGNDSPGERAKMTNNTDDCFVELDFGSTVVPSCSSVNVSVQSKETLAIWGMIEQLLVPSGIAGDFLITDIKVGKDSQFIGPGCLPAAVFSTDAIPELLSGYDLLRANQPVVLSVTNQAAQERTFSAILRCLRIGKKVWPKRNMVGFGSTLVPGGGSARIHSQVTVPFRPERIIVPSSLWGSFKVVSLITGSLSSNGAERVEPAQGSPFAETSPGRVEFKNTVPWGGWLIIFVKNMSNRAANFQGAVAGRVEQRTE